MEGVPLFMSSRAPYRLASPEEVVEIDHENQLLQKQLAKALDMVDNDPARLLTAVVEWLNLSQPGVRACGGCSPPALPAV